MPAASNVNSEFIATGGITVRGLTKRFKDLQALAGLDLDVSPGEIVAVLGPNGAGKSTLLRILATVVLPDAGSAYVQGFDVVRQPSATRRSLGIAIGDERSWYWRLSGRHNLEFFASLYGLRRRAAATRAATLLAEFDLIEAADRRFDGYSAGMRSRLSLARALLPDPPVLLLDEPTRSLDPVAAISFRDRVLQLGHGEGKAVLLATHDLHEAAAISDRVLVLDRGKVAASAPQGDAATLERLLLAAVAR